MVQLDLNSVPAKGDKVNPLVFLVICGPDVRIVVVRIARNSVLVEGISRIPVGKKPVVAVQPLLLKTPVRAPQADILPVGDAVGVVQVQNPLYQRQRR